MNGIKMLNAFHKNIVARNDKRVVLAFNDVSLYKINFITFSAFALLSMNFNLYPFTLRKSNSGEERSCRDVDDINENSSHCCYEQRFC